ncbi:hypothetical protein JQ544_17020 [Bradyrhizobium diazoefficiens]|nr:hypothetical protein [Bradyrhizobium diazoefficiens]MBR0813239.1 hypothetical protein [Bradyrhizobium diazoefficiens]
MKLSVRMVLSPNSVAGGAPFVVVKLITMGGFARDAPNAQNGFFLRENCFVRSEPTTQFSENTNHFRKVSPEIKVACQVPALVREHTRRSRRHAPASRASHAFYVFLLKRLANEGWVLSNRGRVRCDPSHRNLDARNTGRVDLRMAIMVAQDRATPREADQRTDSGDRRPSRVASAGAMSLQSGRGFEAAPQAFVRLTGSHLVKP